MLLSPKENKVQTSNDKNKSCWTATQRPWSVKHEKRDKQNTTFTQRCQSDTKFQTDQSGIQRQTVYRLNQIKFDLEKQSAKNEEKKQTELKKT